MARGTMERDLWQVENMEEMLERRDLEKGFSVYVCEPTVFRGTPIDPQEELWS
jgi:hypothetical protein